MACRKAAGVGRAAAHRAHMLWYWKNVMKLSKKIEVRSAV